MKPITRHTQLFYGNDDHHKRCPMFRGDGTEIDNAAEWHLCQLVELMAKKAKEALESEVLQARTLHTVEGASIDLRFTFKAKREDAGELVPAGMYFECVMERIE